jgi:curved DNA-binding protein CbpA
MKPFDQQNHYEVFELPPDATPFEIRQAYKAGVELYGDDAMATYSFFSESERKKILCRLEEAFVTLINEKARAEYDQTLIRSGELEEGMRYKGVSKKPIPLFKLKSSRGIKPVASGLSKPEPSEPAATPLVHEILSHHVLTGNDLKRIRRDLGMSLDRIAQETKVRITLLRSIEEDQFDELPSRFHLEGFVKSYAQCLRLDPQAVARKYMQRIQP